MEAAPIYDPTAADSGRNGRNWRNRRYLPASVNRILRYRFLLFRLVVVNLRKQYKRSFLGLSWFFILPFFAVVIWVLLSGAGVVRPGDTEIPYPAYVLLSMSIWDFFSRIFQSVSKLIQQNGRLLVKTAFPHEVLFAERILNHLVQFTIPFLVNVGVLLYFGVQFGWAALLFPISLLPLLLLGAGLGLIVAPLRIVALDISELVDQGIKALMLLTPIVYTPKIEVGWLSSIIDYNPLTYLIGTSRALLTGSEAPDLRTYLYTALSSLLLFCLAWTFHRRSIQRILEKLIVA